MAKPNRNVGALTTWEHFNRGRANWKNKGIKTESSFFGSEILLQLLQKPGTIGLRIHYGIDDEGNMQPFLTAELDTASAQRDDDPPANASYPCPPHC